MNKIKDKVNRIMDKFPHLKEKNKPVMTDAERKSATQKKQSEDARANELAADNARKTLWRSQ